MAGSGFPGFAEMATPQSDVSTMEFIVNSVLAGVATVDLVRVDSVTLTGDDSPAPAGIVSCTPLVMQIDGAGQTVRRAQLNRVPFYRMQCGNSAIVMDPVVGDVGLVVYGSRDISSVKETGVASPPGSYRRFDLADALYVGGFVGLQRTTPDQYVQFLYNESGESEGLTISSPGTITINCENAVIHASKTYSWDVNGYGERLTFQSGSTFKLDTYKTGATVNTVSHTWTPPEIPPP